MVSSVRTAAVMVGIGVAVGEALGLAVGAGVAEGVAVGAGVMDGAGVAVGATDGRLPPPHTQHMALASKSSSSKGNSHKPRLYASHDRPVESVAPLSASTQ